MNNLTARLLSILSFIIDAMTVFKRADKKPSENNQQVAVQRMSARGLTLIRKYESFQEDWYICPAGKITIGFGHVKKTADTFATPITKAQAEALFESDVALFERAVLSRVTIPLRQNQFDALVSLAFNIGANNFKNSTLLKKINTGKITVAAQEFDRWVYTKGKVLPGLVARRAAERQLFEE